MQQMLQCFLILNPNSILINELPNTPITAISLHKAPWFKQQPLLFLGICILYLVLQTIGVLHHEWWLDEAQHFLLAKNSSTLSELVYQARYEGHPLLWNVLLYALTRLSDQILYAQILHVLIAFASVFLILNFSPFRLLPKLALIFGYFLSYEFSIICRNYGLALLLVVAVLTYYRCGKRNRVVLSLLLALLLNSHLFGAIVALGFVVILRKDYLAAALPVKIASFLVLAGSLVFMLVHVVPPADHFLYGYNEIPLLSALRFGKLVDAPITGLIPLPDWREANYWNNHPLCGHALLSPLLGVILLATPYFIFRSQGRSLFLFYFCASILLGFLFFSPLRIASRSSGFLSILLLAASWLAQDDTGVSLPKQNRSGRWPQLSNRLQRIYFSVILSVQVMSTILFYVSDLRLDFSAAKKTAMFLESQHSKDLVVLSHFTAGPALRVYCSRPIYYFEAREFGTFCKWATRPLFFNDTLFLQQLDSILSKNHHLLFVSNQEFRLPHLLSLNRQAGICCPFELSELAHFEESVIQSERYFVYLVKAN